MRIVALLLLIFSLAACRSGNRSNDAVRQGVLDYLSGPMGLNLQAMDVKVDSVKFDGDNAKAGVSIALKGNATPMMTKQYDLQLKEGKWVVVGRTGDAGHGAAFPGGAQGGAAAPGANPHEGMTMPPAGGASGADPHAGMAMPPAGGSGSAGGKMPSPDDLPPAGKKK